MAMDFVKSAVENETKISTIEQVNKFLSFIAPLVSDQDDQPAVEDIDLVTPLPCRLPLSRCSFVDMGWWFVGGLCRRTKRSRISCSLVL